MASPGFELKMIKEMNLLHVGKGTLDSDANDINTAVRDLTTNVVKMRISNQDALDASDAFIDALIALVNALPKYLVRRGNRGNYRTSDRTVIGSQAWFNEVGRQIKEGRDAMTEADEAFTAAFRANRNVRDSKKFKALGRKMIRFRKHYKKFRAAYGDEYGV